MRTIPSAETTPSSHVEANWQRPGRIPSLNFWRLLLLFPALSALAIIYFRLRSLSTETLGHLAMGLVVVLGAVTGLGTFLWCVHWGVSRDGKPEVNVRQQSGPGEKLKERAANIPISPATLPASKGINISRREAASSNVGA